MRIALAFKLATMVALISVLAPGAGSSAVPIEGPWLTQDGGGVIDIEPCGSLYCGRIVGLAAASSRSPVPKDANGNPRCGLEIIHGLAQTGPGEWGGQIANPDDGQTYSARLSIDDRGRLRLRGYVLVPLLGQTQIWTRYGGRVTADCRMIPSERPKVLAEQQSRWLNATLPGATMIDRAADQGPKAYA
jgi:uncharacterized protein (DUF2147 family)